MDTLTTIDELGFAPALQQEMLEDTTSDHALLEATRTGDQDAFAELVSRYRNQITSYIYRMTNDYDGAVDLAQETFVRVYRAADQVPEKLCVFDLHLSHRYQPGHQRAPQTKTAQTCFADWILFTERWRRAEGVESTGRPAIARLGTGRHGATQRGPTRDRYASREVPGASDPSRRRRAKLRRDREDPRDERRNG